MNTIEILESNYPLPNGNYNAFQLKLPLDFLTVVPVDDPVTSFVEVMKGINTNKYFNRLPHRGNPGYDPHMMLSVVLFAFMNKVPSLRELEELCKYDIRYMYLADNETPSFMAFQRFISCLRESVEAIFYDICKVLLELDTIDTSVLYIDGTKLEANAKKNSFVWKKAVLNYQRKLFEKITNYIPLINDMLHTNYQTHEKYTSDYIGVITDYLMEVMVARDTTIVYGMGTRKTDIQRLYDTILASYIKLLQYETSLGICGNRNSYSKSDHDATMMNMKYDYYNQTGVFKPGYNLQIGVSDEYVMHAGIFANPTDTKTFIPFMNSYKEVYETYPTWPIGDAGYGSYDNYMYCIENKIELGMKYNYYAKKNDPTFKKKIYHTMNFKTNEEGYKVCPQGHVFNIHEYESHNNKSVYPQISNNYSCGECSTCLVKSSCTTATERKVRINYILQEMQDKVDENLSTPKGKEMKRQRSIQVEGAFGLLKQDIGYTRIRRRGIKNVKTEIFLVLIGFNLRKYHHKKQRVIN